jgi:transcriptional regulator with XRE-family HTH domain
MTIETTANPAPGGQRIPPGKPRSRRVSKSRAAKEVELRAALELQLALAPLSRRDVDRRLGLTPGSTSRLLRGKDPLSDERFLEIGRVLGLPEPELEALRKAKPRRAPGRPRGRRAEAGSRPRFTAREILRFLEERYPEVLADLLRSRAEGEGEGAEPERETSGAT